MQGKHSADRMQHERRGRTGADRRGRLWWSIWYGGFNPRRRSVPRRADESRFHALDWHSPHLLAVAIGIAVLSMVDGLLTLGLLQGGAQEENPIMAAVVYRSAAVFASVKMLLTGVGVILMVVLARYRFMRVLPVAWVLYGVLIAYGGLIGYEVWLQNRLATPFFF
ncbi:MAG TPA: DUF5658 family protein [Steroidobacteraceae bacterium]|jgi:hypothetical protein|nr:DUF5658 family protein [Steroidobacteraceae bacterium]